VVESHVSPDGFELGGLGVGHVELGGVEGVVEFPGVVEFGGVVEFVLFVAFGGVGVV
jgi:hypothetical protein